MAKKSMILKQQAEPKFSTRRYNRCKICGRPHAYLRDYGICRICFRELAYTGQSPGGKKASWSHQPAFPRVFEHPTAGRLTGRSRRLRYLAALTGPFKGP